MRVQFGPIDRPLSYAEQLAVNYVREESRPNHYALWQRCSDDFCIYGNATTAGSVAELVGMYLSWAHSFEAYCQ
jgi:hypothetical protein